jgi:hypothetical protein
MCLAAFFGTINQIHSRSHEHNTCLTLNASEAALANKIVDAAHDGCLVLQDRLVMHLVNQIGTFFDNSERMTLKIGPLGGDGVVMAVTHRAVKKETDTGLATR